MLMVEALPAFARRSARRPSRCLSYVERATAEAPTLLEEVATTTVKTAASPCSWWEGRLRWPSSSRSSRDGRSRRHTAMRRRQGRGKINSKSKRRCQEEHGEPKEKGGEVEEEEEEEEEEFCIVGVLGHHQQPSSANRASAAVLSQQQPKLSAKEKRKLKKQKKTMRGEGGVENDADGDTATVNAGGSPSVPLPSREAIKSALDEWGGGAAALGLPDDDDDAAVLYEELSAQLAAVVTTVHRKAFTLNERNLKFLNRICN